MRILKDKYILILLVVSITIRIIWYCSHPINTGGDTPNYLILAKHISEMNFSGYNGMRTPGFPFIIFLAGLDLNNTVVLQMVMGVIITTGLYIIMYLLSANRWLALFSGLIYSVYLPYLKWETYILSETTAIFFTILTFLSFLLFIKCNTNLRYMYSFLTGFFCSWTVLTKPHTIIIVFVFIGYFIFNYIDEKNMIKKYIFTFILFIMPMFILIGSWVFIIYRNTGTLSLSTLGGVVLFAATDSYIENVPKEYKDIPDSNEIISIYLKHRKEYQKKNKTIPWAIWPAIKEIQERKNWSFAHVSKILGAIGRKNILYDPISYLKYVGKHWLLNWKIGGIEKRECANGIVRFIINYIMRMIFIFFEIFFIIFPLIFNFSKKVQVCYKQFEYTEKIYIMIFYISIFCIVTAMAFISGSDIGRSLVFIESFLFVITFFIIWKLTKLYRINLINSHKV